MMKKILIGILCVLYFADASCCKNGVQMEERRGDPSVRELKSVVEIRKLEGEKEKYEAQMKLLETEEKYEGLLLSE